jgi:Kdo2-lipid IVA lauroyltransferase/acyltransferase
VKASVADRAEYYALRGGMAVLAALPWSSAVSAGARVARLGYRPLGIRARVVEDQIAAAFPEWDRARVRRVARGAYDNLGRVSVEAALLPSLGSAGVRRLFDDESQYSVLERAHAFGRGVILVTGHFGNWELGAAYLAARGLPMDAIARRMANPLFDRYLTTSRRRVGVTVLADSEAVRRVPRSLRDGHVVAFVADQGVKGMASTFVPFFGRPAKTPRGPAVFALRLGVPVVFGTAVRLPSGRYRAVLEPVEIVDTGDRERDVDTVVAGYTAALERWVRQYPEQYFWQHRRWRRQPAAVTEHAVDGTVA